MCIKLIEERDIGINQFPIDKKFLSIFQLDIVHLKDSIIRSVCRLPGGVNRIYVISIIQVKRPFSRCIKIHTVFYIFFRFFSKSIEIIEIIIYLFLRLGRCDEVVVCGLQYRVLIIRIPQIKQEPKYEEGNKCPFSINKNENSEK